MSSDGSVTRWLAPLQGGDSAAVRELWHRYFGRLVGGGPPPPQEGRQVHLHRHAIERDGFRNRLAAEWNEALLPSIAQREEIGGDRIAQELRGDLARPPTSRASAN